MHSFLAYVRIDEIGVTTGFLYKHITHTQNKKVIMCRHLNEKYGNMTSTMFYLSYDVKMMKTEPFLRHGSFTPKT